MLSSWFRSPRSLLVTIANINILLKYIGGLTLARDLHTISLLLQPHIWIALVWRMYVNICNFVHNIFVVIIVHQLHFTLRVVNVSWTHYCSVGTLNALVLRLSQSLGWSLSLLASKEIRIIRKKLLCKSHWLSRFLLVPQFQILRLD